MATHPTPSPRPMSQASQSLSLAGCQVYLDSLGCAKNLVDSEATLGLLRTAGAQLVQDPSLADLLLVNTCGFLEVAREESILRILSLAQHKSYGKARLLAVLGCLVSRAPEELAESMPEVDLWLPAGQHGDLPGLVQGLLSAQTAPSRRQATDRSGSRRAPMGAFSGFGERILLTPSHTAYLKISEGCSNLCSFCSIPLMRGTQRSRPLEDLVDEARRLAREGVRELHLVAQDLTQYGFDLDERPDLLDLARALGQVEGIEWIRLLYAHPAHFTARMLEGLFRAPKLARYLDMPIQHASTPILRAMQRPGNAASMRKLFLALREQVPGITLRTTVIVGFPGEKEEDFQKLCRFIEDVEFDRLGIFTYSREPGTPAFSLSGRPRARTAERRLQELTELQLHIAGRRAAARLGQHVTVLVDAPLSQDSDESSPLAEGACAVGRTEAEALDIDGLVFLEGPSYLQPGSFVQAEIVAADVHDLRARVLAPLPDTARSA